MSKRLRLSLLAVGVLALGMGLLVVLGRGGSTKEIPSSQAEVSESSSIVQETSPSAQAEPTATPKTGLNVVRLVVPSLGIDAPTVVLGVTSDGTMQSPATPTDVGWYNFSSKPDGGGNIVISGHVDYVNYGPAVFWKLRDIHMGDVIHVLLTDQSVVTYKVTTISNYQANSAPVQEIIGKTPVETLTLITCDGAFNSQTHQYDKRLVVRAIRA